MRRQSPFRMLACLAASSCLCAIALTPLVASGCASREEVMRQRTAAAGEKTKVEAAGLAAQDAAAHLQELMVTLQAQRAELQVVLANAATTAEARALTSAALTAATARAQEVQATLEAANKAVSDGRARAAALGASITAADGALARHDSGENPAGALGPIVGAVTGNPLTAVLTAVLGGLGWRQLLLQKAVVALRGDNANKSTALTNIITSIDALGTIVPEVAAAIDKHGALLDSIQKGVGKAEVDRVQATTVRAAA